MDVCLHLSEADNFVAVTALQQGNRMECKYNYYGPQRESVDAPLT